MPVTLVWKSQPVELEVRVMPGFAVAGGVILMQSYLQIKFFLLLKHEYLYWEMNIVIFKLLFKRN